MAQILNQKLIIKLIILSLCILKIIQGKKLEYHIKKTTKIIVKKHKLQPLTLSKDPIKTINPVYSYENRENFVEKEFDAFKLKSETILNNEKVEKENVSVPNEEIINNKKVEVQSEGNTETINNNNKTNDTKSDNSYYLLGGGVVSIALVGVGFFNVYQRSRNSIFNLTKEELESLDKSAKINNSYTSLSEEEKRFLHKINTRKHNNMRRFDELTEEEILSIRKRNGWADSDDGECHLRRRKIDKRLSSNVKINRTNSVAPRRVSLNVQDILDNKLSNTSFRRSFDDTSKLKKKINAISAEDSLIKHTTSQESLESSTKNMNNRKRLSINTKNLTMPPIKMVCTIVKNYKPLRSDEIELHLGDKVEIIKIYKDGWATGKVISDDENGNQNKVGYFPLAHASEPEIFDDNINENYIPSPLTSPVSHSFSNSSYQNSPLAPTSPFSNILTNTTTTTKATKSKNRQVSMIAVSSSSSVLTQEPISITSSNNTSPSIININNNINIFQNNINENENTPRNINININIDSNSNVNQKTINNRISIDGCMENENTTLLTNTNTLFFSAPTTPVSVKSNRTSLLEPQVISNLLNEVLEEENIKKTSLPCHSQEVFDFLRSNVYNSEIPMDERDYYKKCLERLRMSKLIDMEINQN